MSKRARRKPANSKRPKSTLGLPDLDHGKAAVLDSLRSPESKRGYRHAIDEFIQWYCSEPRLSFNKVVVTRFRIFLENRGLAPATINGRLAAVRRLAYEAADAGLLSPELAASIRRVKGPKKLGVRLGNWLMADEARRFWQTPDREILKRQTRPSDSCNLTWLRAPTSRASRSRVHALAAAGGALAIVDLVGKGGHIRTVPVPEWVKATLDAWVHAAELHSGKIFRFVSAERVSAGVMGSLSESCGMWSSCMPQKPALLVSLLTILGAHAQSFVTPRAASWSKSSSCSDMFLCRQPSVISAATAHSWCRQ